MTTLTHEVLLEACSPGGSTCLVSSTDLLPAAGPHASVAPAKFAAKDSRDKAGAFAYEKRYLDGALAQAVVVDTKQSQLNRCEAALVQAIDDGHPLLSRLPRVTVTYTRDGREEVYSDLTLPHRVFDGHIRAGTVDGTPVTQLPAYRAIRDSAPANARALLDASPISLVFGSWDSFRASRQGRWRSLLVGEVVGFCSDDAAAEPARRGGARTDPVGMRIEMSPADVKALGERQKDELGKGLYDKLAKGKEKPSSIGLGGIPPLLETLAGVACYRIVRSHVLSFAALRQIRFGAGAEGDAACRALLSALALAALARADSELTLRANCDLREAAPTTVELDRRGGESSSLEALGIAAADELLQAAYDHAHAVAGVSWDGVALAVTGDPAIVAGAADEAPAGAES